jgi:hypothetical protein
VEAEAQDRVHPIILRGDGIEMLVNEFSFLGFGDLAETERD